MAGIRQTETVQSDLFKISDGLNAPASNAVILYDVQDLGETHSNLFDTAKQKFLLQENYPITAGPDPLSWDIQNCATTNRYVTVINYASGTAESNYVFDGLGFIWVTGQKSFEYSASAEVINTGLYAGRFCNLPQFVRYLAGYSGPNDPLISVNGSGWNTGVSNTANVLGYLQQGLQARDIPDAAFKPNKRYAPLKLNTFIGLAVNRPDVEKVFLVTSGQSTAAEPNLDYYKNNSIPIDVYCVPPSGDTEAVDRVEFIASYTGGKLYAYESNNWVLKRDFSNFTTENASRSILSESTFYFKFPFRSFTPHVKAALKLVPSAEQEEQFTNALRSPLFAPFINGRAKKGVRAVFELTQELPTLIEPLPNSPKTLVTNRNKAGGPNTIRKDVFFSTSIPQTLESLFNTAWDAPLGAEPREALQGYSSSANLVGISNVDEVYSTTADEGSFDIYFDSFPDLDLGTLRGIGLNFYFRNNTYDDNGILRYNVRMQGTYAGVSIDESLTNLHLPNGQYVNILFPVSDYVTGPTSFKLTISPSRAVVGSITGKVSTSSFIIGAWEEVDGIVGTERGKPYYVKVTFSGITDEGVPINLGAKLFDFTTAFLDITTVELPSSILPQGASAGLGTSWSDLCDNLPTFENNPYVSIPNPGPICTTPPDCGGNVCDASPTETICRTERVLIPYGVLADGPSLPSDIGDILKSDDATLHTQESRVRSLLYVEPSRDNTCIVEPDGPYSLSAYKASGEYLWSKLCNVPLSKNQALLNNADNIELLFSSKKDSNTFQCKVPTRIYPQINNNLYCQLSARGVGASNFYAVGTIPLQTNEGKRYLGIMLPYSSIFFMDQADLEPVDSPNIYTSYGFPNQSYIYNNLTEYDTAWSTKLYVFIFRELRSGTAEFPGFASNSRWTFKVPNIDPNVNVVARVYWLNSTAGEKIEVDQALLGDQIELDTLTNTMYLKGCGALPYENSTCVKSFIPVSDISAYQGNELVWSEPDFAKVRPVVTETNSVGRVNGTPQQIFDNQGLKASVLLSVKPGRNTISVNRIFRYTFNGPLNINDRQIKSLETFYGLTWKLSNASPNVQGVLKLRIVPVDPDSFVNKLIPENDPQFFSLEQVTEELKVRASGQSRQILPYLPQFGYQPSAPITANYLDVIDTAAYESMERYVGIGTNPPLFSIIRNLRLDFSQSNSNLLTVGNLYVLTKLKFTATMSGQDRKEVFVRHVSRTTSDNPNKIVAELNGSYFSGEHLQNSGIVSLSKNGNTYNLERASGTSNLFLLASVPSGVTRWDEIPDLHSLLNTNVLVSDQGSNLIPRVSQDQIDIFKVQGNQTVISHSIGGLRTGRLKGIISGDTPVYDQNGNLTNTTLLGGSTSPITSDFELYYQNSLGVYQNRLDVGKLTVRFEPVSPNIADGLRTVISGSLIDFEISYLGDSNESLPTLQINNLEVFTEELTQTSKVLSTFYEPKNKSSLVEANRNFAPEDIIPSVFDVYLDAYLDNFGSNIEQVDSQLILDFVYAECIACNIPVVLPTSTPPGLPQSPPPPIEIPLLPPGGGVIVGPPAPPAAMLPPPPVNPDLQNNTPIPPAPPTGGGTGGSTGGGGSNSGGGGGGSPPPPPTSPPVIADQDDRKAIYVSFDCTELPIQAGGASPRSTARISAHNLPPGEYPVVFTATRCDGSIGTATTTLTVLGLTSEPNYTYPVISENDLPMGFIGREYNPELKQAKLEILDSTDSGLIFTSLLIGQAGNSIEVVITVDKSGTNVLPNKPLLVNVVNAKITVKCATDLSGNVTSTIDQVKNAIRQNSLASQLVQVVVKGDSQRKPVIADEAKKLANGTAPKAILSATGGTPNPQTGLIQYTWSLHGPGLPPGLYLDSSTGAIYGTPTQSGDFPVTVHLSDGYLGRISKQFTLSVYKQEPKPLIQEGEIRCEPTCCDDEVVPNVAVIPEQPIEDVNTQTLAVIRDGRRGFWGPPPLVAQLLSPTDNISGPIAWEGRANWFRVEFESPTNPGPWTEIRFIVSARKSPFNDTNDMKVMLTLRPTSSGTNLRNTANYATLPLTTSWNTTEASWHGVWYSDEIKNLGIRIEPTVLDGISDTYLMEHYIEIESITAVVRSIPLPQVALEVQPLVAGTPAGMQQLTPNLTTEYKNYQLVWTGRWTKSEIDELSVSVDARIQEDRADAPTPWVMLKALEVQLDQEPPPEVPFQLPSVPDLFDVTLFPLEAADLESHIFTVRVKSNNYDGNVFLQFIPIGTNPGLAATFADNIVEISTGETVEVDLTITNLTAAEGATLRFQVVAVAATGQGSGASPSGTYFVNKRAPLPLTDDVLVQGATEFFVTPVPAVRTLPTSGTTTFALNLVAPLGVTPVAVSANIRPTPSEGVLQVFLTPTQVTVAPSLVRTITVRVDSYQVPEDTYSIDFRAVGSDGNIINTRSVLVVQGPPETPVPELPPVPPATATPDRTVVETLVPNAFLKQFGILTGGYLNIASGVDVPDDDTAVVMNFGPPPLKALAAIDLNMTDPESDSFWYQVTIRVRLRMLRDVQDPTFTFQPVIENQPVGALKSISREQGLSLGANTFAHTWEGSWTTNQIRSLVVQVAGFTTGAQTELNGIEILEVDAVVAGTLRRPAAPLSPFRLFPTSVIESQGSWSYVGGTGAESVDDDVDCAADADYARITIAPGNTAVIKFAMSNPPITASWEQFQARARVLLENGASPVGFQASIIYPGRTTQYGNAVALPAGSWYVYRHVYQGIWTDIEAEGLALLVTLINSDLVNSATVKISAADVIASGRPEAIEDWKLVPVELTQISGTTIGQVTAIDEGLAWPEELPTGVNPEVLNNLPVRTSPDPLPDGPQSSITSPNDEDYLIVPLSDEGQWSQLFFKISQPPAPSLGVSPPPPGPPGPPALPPGPPGFSEDDWYTSLRVRVRLQQDPRIVYPSITDIDTLPPLTFRQSDNTLPNAQINQAYRQNITAPVLSVTGGLPPYQWNVFIVTPQGNNLAGLPAGMTYEVNPQNSAEFFLRGTPLDAGLYQFGIAVVDSRSTVTSANFFLQVVDPTVSPLPPTPSPPGGGGGSPPSPPPPVPPGPPAPPIPDMYLFAVGYSRGIDPDTGILWRDRPENNTNPAPPGEAYVSPIRFAEIGDIVEVPVKLYELAGFARTGLDYEAVIVPSTGQIASGVFSAIEGSAVGSNPPSTITANGSTTFNLRVRYSGLINAEEKGTIELSAEGIPDKFGNINEKGLAGTSLKYEYLGIVTIQTENLPQGVLGQPYSEQLSAIGGNPPYNWGVLNTSSGGLPQNLVLDSNGNLSGVPIQQGDFLFRVVVVDSRGRQAIKNLNLTVVPFVAPVPPSPPSPPTSPPPGLPPGSGSPPVVLPPPPPVPPSPPTNLLDPVPDITVRVQPLLANNCSDGVMYGLGPRTINGFLIPRPETGTVVDPAEGTWGDFEFTWTGAWTYNQIKELMVSVEAYLDGTIAAGVRNNLYISALDVIATRASGPQITVWPSSLVPQGRLQWLSSRAPGERGWTSGKWTNFEIMPYRDGQYIVDGIEKEFKGYIESILGTAHKGGNTQENANAVLDRYEIYGWLDIDGDGKASYKDLRVTANGILLQSISPTATTISVANLYALQDEKDKPRLGFLLGTELIQVEAQDIDWENGQLKNVLRGANETIAQSHAVNTPIYLVPYWEKLYEVRIAGKAEDDPEADAVGWDTPPNTDDGTPGNLLQWGGLDLRSYSGNYPIRWMLRLRVVDIYGITTETNILDPALTDRFKTVGPGAHFGIEGDPAKGADPKRLLYIKQAKPPGAPRIQGSQ